ncbi:hypothetical protein [Virgibacillus salexigens]|uniref:Uncharacterized protein n=1 Tax=Virgibacillus massiliensis TaxID=1462526 RepID=A0A024QI80_9BACI|nr:hypothetical protein [Virgibacillus massiliensis]CDQ41932.1 hypothetical protein BN990_04311 [Virgibacillus massiliensis]
MELVTAYLYMTSPIPSENISAKSFYKLKENNWYQDNRGSQKFQILNKRFKIDQNWYKVGIRFERSQDNYVLNTPIPFFITEAETDNGQVFTDKVVHHGRKVKHTLGYLHKGIPIELIDAVIQDLKEHLIYTN